MKENDEFILDIKRLGINAEGIGFYNKLAVFVKEAIPGEGINVKVTKVEKNMAFADIVEIKHKSEYRIEPICKHYYECGGCMAMHIKYEKMLEFKRDLLIEAINKYTKLNPKSFEIKETIKSDNILGYRNRSILPVKRGIDEKLHVCMIKPNTNYLTPVEDCVVQNPLINELNNKILKYADELRISPYAPKFDNGILRFISIRVNLKNEALVTFVCFEKSDKIKELAKKVIKLENVKGVYVNYNTSKKQGFIFSDNLVHLEGDKSIIEEVGNIKYELYPTTFFQLNTNQAKNMVDTVLKLSKLSRKERVLDAYCGVGAIGLYISKMAKEVIGVESSHESIDAANNNAKLNHISNAKFIEGDSSKVLTDMVEKGERFDVVIVDPPRVGLNNEFIESLLKSETKRIIYVSCNPSTLAKNLDKLSLKYNVNQIIPLDMFPNTQHVESITLLVRKDTK